MQNSSLPYQNLQTILKRMKYDLSKTSTENSKFLNEQTLKGEFGISPEQKEKQKKISQTEKEVEISKKYPNYCKYPEKTLPVDEDLILEFRGYCKYTRPQYNVKKSQSIEFWVPQDASIVFSSEEFINEEVEMLSKKYQIKNKEKLTQNLYDIFPLESVMSFNSKIGNYRGIITFDKLDTMEDATWYFQGYKKDGFQGTQWYEEPQDTRTDLEEFVDNMSWWYTLAAMFAAQLAGIPQPYLAVFEVALSLITGGLMFWRNMEKGEKIQATFDVLFALLPGLQFSKEFRGIDPRIFKEVVKDLSRLNLENADDVKRYYNSLNNSSIGRMKQKLIVKIARTDLMSAQELVSALKGTISDPKKLVELISTTVGKEREKFLKLAFSDVVWKKELGIAGAVLLTNVASNLIFGRQLTKNEEEIAKSIFVKIPESHRMEMSENIANDPEVLSVLEKRFSSEQQSELAAKNMGNWYRSTLKYIMGEKYVPDENLPEVQPNFPSSEENKYRQMGYVTFKELKSDEKMGADKIFIGGKLFIKPEKYKK